MNNKKPGVSPPGIVVVLASTIGIDYQGGGHTSSPPPFPGSPGGAGPSVVAPLGIGRISVTGAGDPVATSVRICAHGTIIHEGGRVVSKPAKSGGKRGKVVTWSKQSRARLRRILAMSKGPDGSTPIGFTGTIPGDLISESEYRQKVWKTFRRFCPPILVIWRVELQERKQPHAHMVCWVRDALDTIKLWSAWTKAVQALGPVKWEHPDYGECTGFRTAMPGADRYMIAMTEQGLGDEFGWWRYLASHTGKGKQEQLGWVGRNWGVINPSLRGDDNGEKFGITRRQWFSMRRWLRRLTGYRGAGCGNSSVWYVNPSTIQAMVGLARSL